MVWALQQVLLEFPSQQELREHAKILHGPRCFRRYKHPESHETGNNEMFGGLALLLYS